MIVADHLQKTFEDGFVAAAGLFGRGRRRDAQQLVAVKDATFRVGPGETLGILGANGAGKTTTLHMLLGFLEPSSGKSFLNGVCVQDDPLEAKKHVGYVSENVLLYGALSAQQNLRFFARISGKDVPAERVAAALERVGLAGASRRRVETFSKGMRQRLGIAVALVKDPAALVLDEPTTGLDPAGVRDLHALLAELRAEGKAILLVTHDLYRLQQIADRVTVVRDGTMTEPIRPESVRDLERLYHGEVAALG